MKPAGSTRRLRVEAAVVAAAIVIAAIAGPFGTWRLSGEQRALFWAAAILLNAAKWGLWYRLVAPRFGAGRRGVLAAALAGAILLNLTLPLEIEWLMHAVGLPIRLAYWPLYLTALAISAAITTIVVTVMGTAAPAPAAAGPIPATGLLARANAAAADLLAVEAEDHYLRLHLTGGRRPLILYRFKDALAELAPLDGAQVHRGTRWAQVALAPRRRHAHSGQRQLRRRRAGSRLAAPHRTGKSVMSQRTLYTFWRSSAAYRVRIALGLKGLDYDSKPVDLRTGAQQGIGYKLLNPQGFVPYLIDGEVGLNQSLAIIEWLDETYPEPPLLPADPLGRARVRAAALTIACDIHPLNNLRVLKYLKDPLGQEQEAIDAWAQHWIGQGFAPLEEIAEGSPGPYLFGDAPTLADVCLVPQMYNARRVRTDLTPFPRLVEIDKRLLDLPQIRNARPEAQADADV